MYTYIYTFSSVRIRGKTTKLLYVMHSISFSCLVTFCENIARNIRARYLSINQQTHLN